MGQPLYETVKYRVIKKEDSNTFVLMRKLSNEEDGFAWGVEASITEAALTSLFLCLYPMCDKGATCLPITTKDLDNILIQKVD